MKTSLRNALSVMVLIPLAAISGCGSASAPAPSPSSTSTEQAASPSPSSIASQEPSTPTPTSTAESTSVAGVTVPTGWEQGKNWVDTNASRAYGLKSGVAVLSGSQTATILSSYDKEGKIVSKSTPVSTIPDFRSNDLFSSYAGGKPYLILVQSGELAPHAGTPDATEGVYYCIMDAVTGKIVHEKMHDTKTYLSEKPRSDGNFVTFNAMNREGIPSTYVINPVTGAVDEVAETETRRWMARVDGVDIYADYENESRFKIIGVSTSKWSIPGAHVDKVSGSKEDLRPLAQGGYINLATDANPCMVIDVHTGVEAPFSAKDPSLCMSDYESPVLKEDDARLYFDVLPMIDSNKAQSYLNPKTGKSVNMTDGDTFVGAFTGGDGMVYGVTSTIPSEMLPAKIDLNEEKLEALGTSSGTGMIHAASGDGVIAIPTSDSPSNLEYLFLTK